MPNAFDQFDTKPTTGNTFDQFDTTTPKLPDTNRISDTAKNNLTANATSAEGETKAGPPPTPEHLLNTAGGMPITEQLKGNASPFTPEMRGHLVDSYKAGTSQNAADFMQTAVPVLAHSTTAGAFARGAEISALPSTAGFAAFGAGAMAGAEAVAPIAPFTGPGAPFVEGAGALVGGTLAALGGSYLTAEGQKKFLDSHPQIAEKLGISNEQLLADIKEHPVSSFVGQLAPNLAFMRPSLTTNVKQVALGGGLMGAQETGRELVEKEKLDPEKIAVSTIMGAISNKQTILGEAISGKVALGMNALKPIVGKILGKDAESVTHDDVNGVISSGYKDAAPAAKDFDTVATIMNHRPDYFHGTRNDFENKPIESGYNTNGLIYFSKTPEEAHEWAKGGGYQSMLQAEHKSEFDIFEENHPEIAKEGIVKDSDKLLEMKENYDLPIKGNTPQEIKDSYERTHAKISYEGINIHGVNLDLKNIHPEMPFKEAEKLGAKWFQDKGYDSVIVNEGGGEKSLAVFSANQVRYPHETLTNMLHEIYKQTGVRPEQVYEDSQNDPTIAADVSAGKVPDAYQHLIEKSVTSNIAQEGIPEEHIPGSKEYSKRLYDTLHQKLGSDTATDIVSMKRELEAKKAVGKELDEKFYRKKEDSSVELTPEEQTLYDQHIKPLAAEERALYEKARSLGFRDKEDTIGIEPESEDYVHRIVKGKGHYLDRYSEEFGSDENVGFGKRRGLAQSTASLKEAQFYALEDAEGNRVLKKGEIPEGKKAGDVLAGENGEEYTIKRAKTEEIENNSEFKYYKSAIGNTEDNIRRLEKTIRNIEFLDSLKSDVQKSGLGTPPSDTFHPSQQEQVNIPQLRGWSFDPRVAEVLNDIYDRGGDGLAARISNFLIKGMFLNPIPHIENVYWDYFGSRGWRNVQAIKGVNYLAQGIRDVKEFSPEYIDVLKRGAAARLPAVWKSEFYNGLQRQFLSEIRDSAEGADLAKAWGFDTPAALIESVYNNTQKVLWGSGDALLMAKIRELKDHGMSTDEAVKEAAKHIVDYRIPPRVGEEILGPTLSRLLAKALQGNPVLVFTRYHYGLFKSLGNMVKDVATVGKDPQAAKTAVGQLFATAFLLAVVNPAISSIATAITGKEMKFRNPGITGLVGALTDTLNGRKDISEALKTQFIVSPALQVGSDLVHKHAIINPDLGHEGVQLMDYLMKQPSMSIPSIAYDVREGKKTTGEEALSQVGVTEKKEYKPKKPSRKAKERLAREERELLGE